MKLRFIGANNSMGLKHGKVYKVTIVVQDGYIWVNWGIRICPYSSLAAFCANWTDV